MRAGDVFNRCNAYLRSHERARVLASRLARPLRRSALPVLSGHGRGLRVRVGPSTLTRIFASVEPEVEEVFLSLLKPGSTVYDIGANIGWFALLAARRVGASGLVVAFEPSVTNMSVLQANALTNGFMNVDTVPAAVSDHDGWGRFLSTNSLQGRLDHAGDGYVPLLAVDSWIAATGQKPPDVVKIDVEGAEAQVLRGMRETLQSARPILIVELHGTTGNVADELESIGYGHSLIDAPGPTREGPWWAHVLATPARSA